MNNTLTAKAPRNLQELQKKLEQERREKEQQENIQKTELLKKWEGREFQTQRFKVVKRVFLERVKKDKVYLKRERDAKDSFSISIAEFFKFYSPVEP